ncbi:Rieske 2Fe-2S domain-containing protein [Modestobacter sp. I12A-02628]|uniref:Aromatic ring-hydroxylating dioxygenase subunit alpha n=1 Tax=Goekera deserti TaxID=2497753 RepID=A0A7K3WIU3_9ACTN|nr:aromatic ring-hydroxylating dioxygenase subunit alpha [Goekera deserti]MPQ96518.1 Rieske 2Fe-2S domain-containing protein [Goekera deserti]NDI47167.1 Rieske 2Fe-2S domain-containing protein [Goekera deserti]NEL55433.1 aromatic ring-hydroxylating dioxygenase subunit alpha [Goekera deserti]
MTISEVPGRTRTAGLSWYDLVGEDEHPPAEHLRRRHPYTARTQHVPVERYTSRAWHEAERRHLWRRVWQMACREEHLPEVGSYVVYDIAGDSYLVTRTRDGSIRAYVNACLHRGRALKDDDGRCSEFRCSFHGFTWKLDGTLRHMPGSREFPEIEADRDAWRLPEAAVGTWGGFVFLNPDPDAEPLADFLGGLPEHFRGWDLEHRYVQAHVAKQVRCNWKVAQEAFDEGLHLGATHPQSAPYVGDANSAVDVYGTWARQISPSGTPIEEIPVEPTERDILARMLDVREGEDLPIPFEQRTTARDSMATAARERWRAVLGDEVDGVSDAEFVDHWNYAVFPNLHPWGAFNRIVYRFRPDGDRHDRCIFEVMFLTPFRGERPPPAPVRRLGLDDPWTEATELQTLALVMEQDCFNMEAVQRGLQATRRSHLITSDFQEDVISWRHDLLTDWVERPAARERA